MPDMLRRFYERSDQAKIDRLETEALRHLRNYRSTTDLRVRAEAWTGLMRCADELVKIEGKK